MSLCYLYFTQMLKATQRELKPRARTHTHREVIWPHACTHKHIDLKEMTQQKKKPFNGTFLYANSLNDCNDITGCTPQNLDDDTVILEGVKCYKM